MTNKTQAAELLDRCGAVHLKDVLSKDLCRYLTHVLLRHSSSPSANGDQQVPGAMTVMSHEIVFETILESQWPRFEDLLGFELLPTYAYARLYTNGNVLERHIDRPSCEISATVQLGRSHHYSWPIHMGGNRFDLAEGDAVIYRGCDVEHWRNACDGPSGYYSGQAFLHFVKKNGQHSQHACDPANRSPWNDMFVKHRTSQMDSK
jgi:hypothetical protein